MPYGTDSQLVVFQAINCLATIIQSLRDNKPAVHIFDATSLRVAGFEDEDDDEDESEAPGEA